MIPVVLSGGSGTRLWPVSRASYPKQFCEFYDQSFLVNTHQRLRSFGAPWILTVESMRGLTLKLAHDLGIPKNQILFEPFAKNTGPAMALLCHHFSQLGFEDEIVGVFPSDHIITDPSAFEAAILVAEKAARRGSIVTLGIQPRFAATGYGYIEIGAKLSSSEPLSVPIHTVLGFREKPDQAKADEYLQSKQFLWNAGLFVFRVRDLIAAFATHLPEVWNRIHRIDSQFANAKYEYANCPSVSIDYGIMEKLENQICIPCDMGWSDVGSWDELSRLSEENTGLTKQSHTQVFVQDSESNFVFSIRNKVVGLIGVRDLLVVDSPDALLVCKKGDSQRVKELVEQVKAAGLPEATEHPFETRPWGGFEVLADHKEFKAKRIQVDAGQQLSYQSHKQRSEHWVVVSGKGELNINDVKRTLGVGESVDIPVGAKHRIRNPGPEPLIFVEVQLGTYFGEDDILRFEDDYSRV